MSIIKITEAENLANREINQKIIKLFATREASNAEIPGTKIASLSEQRVRLVSDNQIVQVNYFNAYYKSDLPRLGVTDENILINLGEIIIIYKIENPRDPRSRIERKRELRGLYQIIKYGDEKTPAEIGPNTGITYDLSKIDYYSILTKMPEATEEEIIKNEFENLAYGSYDEMKEDLDMRLHSFALYYGKDAYKTGTPDMQAEGGRTIDMTDTERYSDFLDTFNNSLEVLREIEQEIKDYYHDAEVMIRNKYIYDTKKIISKAKESNKNIQNLLDDIQEDKLNLIAKYFNNIRTHAVRVIQAAYLDYLKTTYLKRQPGDFLKFELESGSILGDISYPYLLIKPSGYNVLLLIIDFTKFYGSPQFGIATFYNQYSDDWYASDRKISISLNERDLELGNFLVVAEVLSNLIKPYKAPFSSRMLDPIFPKEAAIKVANFAKGK